jgi:hypothetical protein
VQFYFSLLDTYVPDRKPSPWHIVDRRRSSECESFSTTPTLLPRSVCTLE